MVFLWKDLAYKIEQVNLRQKSFMRLTHGFENMGSNIIPVDHWTLRVVA
jgi:hypothetical protein